MTDRESSRRAGSPAAPGAASSGARPLEGRVVVITGAAGNLGRATSLAFARAGARLVLVGRDLESLRASLGDLAGAPDGAVDCFAADLADGSATAALARDVLSRLGGVDAVAHTAGAFRGGQPVVETPVEVLDAMLRANLYAPFAVARAFLPGMLERGRGSLTFVAALAGLRGRPGLAAYCASKSGVVRLMESLAEETRDTGVRVNCLLPDAIAAAGGGAGTAPEAIADVLVYLASDQARAITGAAIPV